MRWEFHRGDVFSHDNSPGHRALATQKKLAYMGFQFLDHPPYSTDVSQLDYRLFPLLKIKLKNSHFSFDMEVIPAVEIGLEGQFSENL